MDPTYLQQLVQPDGHSCSPDELITVEAWIRPVRAHSMATFTAIEIPGRRRLVIVV